MIPFLIPAAGFSKGKIFKNSLYMEFVLIPAGTFTMGSPPNEPHRQKSEGQYQVTITKPFYMQNTEVTNKQWTSLMGKKLFGGGKGKVNRSKVKVAWFDVIKFIEKLNALNEGTYRLPTEAEWEYACRAGSTTAYSWGTTIDCSKAKYSSLEDCKGYLKSRGFNVKGPVPVKSYAPNAWGLYDMHGNVWEWCQDWFAKYPEGAAIDPKGPDSKTEGRVRRGGSWFKYGYSCRSANRAYAHPASRFQTTGFRVVREAE